MRAALQMFLQHGYSGTSMKALAQEVGVSAPALYWYFPSKEDLYVSVIDQAMRDFLAHVRQSITESDPVRRLGQMVRAHVSWQLQQADVARAFDLTMSLKSLSHDIPVDRLEPIRQMELDYVQDFRRVLTEGSQQGLMQVEDVKTAAFAIITLCEYVHTWYRPGGPMTIDTVANTYEGLVRNLVGVTAVEEQRRLKAAVST